MFITPEIKQSAFDGLWDYSITGIALVSVDGTFLYINPLFCDLLGYAESELQHKTFQMITHPDDTAADVEMSSKVSSGLLNVYTMSKRYITKMDKIIWVRLKVTAIRDVNDVFICFLTQVSELIELNPPIIKIDNTKKEKSNIIEWVRTNWQMIVFAMTSIAGIIAYIIEKIK